MPRRLTALASLPALALTGAACGSRPLAELPPAAEPARAPALDARPAGRVVPVGGRPEGLAFEPRSGLVAVGLRDPDALALLDPAAGRVVRRVPLPESPRHLQTAPGGLVLVPAERANALVQVRLPGGAARTTPVGRFPHDATFQSGRIFVADEYAHTLTVVDPRTARRVATVPAANQPGGLAPAGRDGVALVAVRERVLELHDARTLRRIAQAPAGVGPTHVVSDGRNLVWVVDTRGDAVLQFHLRPRLELTRRTRVPGRPYGVAYDPERHVLYVTRTAHNRVTVLGTRLGIKTVGSFPSVRQPDTVAVDPRTGRVFVSGKVAGVVQVHQPPAP